MEERASLRPVALASTARAPPPMSTRLRGKTPQPNTRPHTHLNYVQSWLPAARPTATRVAPTHTRTQRVQAALPPSESDSAQHSRSASRLDKARRASRSRAAAEESRHTGQRVRG